MLRGFAGRSAPAAGHCTRQRSHPSASPGNDGLGSRLRRYLLAHTPFTVADGAIGGYLPDRQRSDPNYGQPDSESRKGVCPCRN